VTETEEIAEHQQLKLSDPVMVAAFRGWNDAGEGASFAVQHLVRVWSAQKLASIEPEEFFDFQAVRPRIELEDGITRKIVWPANDFFAARLANAPHDVILLVGTEPNLRWRRFSELVVAMAKRHGVKLLVTLGALLADVAHSRPVPITATAADERLVQKLRLQPSRYEGPTGIVGVLHTAFARAGLDSASLWAAVPHYLAVSPNPKAALALVDGAVQLVGAPADIDDLSRASAVYEERVSEIVASDDDVQAYVRMLEERTDRERFEPQRMPSGEALAAELERFLRQRNEGNET
jgi:predicted ATP-grasp superfamily ATP-dependent carboligase